MWNEEKKLYTIYEWTLPFPIGFRQIGLFAAGAIIWMPIMATFNIPFTSPVGFVLWFTVPVLLAIFGNKQIFEGKSIFQFLQSVIGFFFEPKQVLDGEGVSMTSEKMQVEDKTKPDPHVFQYEVWTKDKLGRF